MAGLPASYFCIEAFSETDLTEDLKKIGVPTLILHGDADQIVPIADSALLSAKIIGNVTLRFYEGAPNSLLSCRSAVCESSCVARPQRFTTGETPTFSPASR